MQRPIIIKTFVAVGGSQKAPSDKEALKYAIKGKIYGDEKKYTNF